MNQLMNKSSAIWFTLEPALHCRATSIVGAVEGGHQLIAQNISRMTWVLIVGYHVSRTVQGGKDVQ